MNTNFRLILSMYSRDKNEIISLIRAKERDYIYYDRDSEDKGTYSPEIALLRLTLDIFDSPEEISLNIQPMLAEFSWVISICLNSCYSGEFYCGLCNTHDYFWEIAQRYSNMILEIVGIPGSFNFSFNKLLDEYGYSYKKINISDLPACELWVDPDSM